MKKLFLFLLAITVVFTACASVIAEAATPETFNWGTNVLKIAAATLTAGFATAYTHLVAKTFVWKPFWADTGRPAIISFVVAVGLMAIDVYVKVLDRLLEAIGVTTDINDVNTFVVGAGVLLLFIKGLSKSEATRAKVAARAKVAKAKA